MMQQFTINKATSRDVSDLAWLGAETFRQSHGHSLEEQDIDEFINRNHTPTAVAEQLAQADNIYHIVRSGGKAIAYSKLALHAPHPGSDMPGVCKLDRIYVLEDFISLKIGEPLLQVNLELARQQQQKGVWLFVWIENARAIRFYTRMGFGVIANHDFRVSGTRVNPNHVMYRDL